MASARVYAYQKKIASKAAATARTAAKHAKKPTLYNIGKKEVYLPDHVITLLHDPQLPPSRAKFHVPLTFSKFDLHDYLLHAYRVKTTDIRSWVVQSPLRRMKPNIGDFQISLATGRGFWRPPANKYMIVEMTEPFVWPGLPQKSEVQKRWVERTEMVDGVEVTRRVREETTVEVDDLEPWGKKVVPDDNPNKERGEELEMEKFRKTLREQAQELLRGERKWQPTWMELSSQK